MRDVMAGGERVRAQVVSDIRLLVKRDKSHSSLLKAASDRVGKLTVGTSQVMDAAVSQLAAQHRFSSEGAASADLLGHMELLTDILGEIPKKGSR